MELRAPEKVTFTIPILPPSVNHYVEHPGAGIHRKSAAAKAFGRDFPLFSRGLFVVSQSGRFSVTLDYWLGKGDRGDVDNFNKLPLDCAAKAGMLRNKKGKEVSDAWIKRMTVNIHDSDEDRKLGPQTVMTIEGME